MTSSELRIKLRQTLGGDNRFLEGDLIQVLQGSGAYHYEIINLAVEQEYRGVAVMVTWSEGGAPERIIATIDC